MPVRLLEGGLEPDVPGSPGRIRSRSDRRKRSGWLVVTGVTGILLTLGLGCAGYWRYVNTIPPFVPPASSTPNPNGYPEATAVATRLLGPPGGTLPPRWPYATPAELRAQVRAAAPELAKLRHALLLDWKVTPPESPAVFQPAARFLVAESRLAGEEGEAHAALHRALDALELGSKLSRGANGQVAGEALACHRLGFVEAERLAIGGGPELPRGAAARVRRIRRAWAAEPEIIEAQRQSDLAALTEETREFCRRPIWEQAHACWDARNEMGLGGAAALFLTPRRRFVAFVDDYYRRCVAESRKPLLSRTPVKWDGPPGLDAALNLPPLLDWQWARAQTELSLLEVMLAAREYRQRHGRFPSRLQKIDRDLLPEVPVDPWGSRVAYRLSGSRPHVYSPGPDRVDNGGRAVKPFPLSAATRGDLVMGRLTHRDWRKPAPVRER